MATTDRTKNKISLEEEAEIVLRAMQGDQDALTRIYEQNVDAIYSFFFRKVRSVTEAEALTSETFMRVIKQLMMGRYTLQGKAFRGWLYAIAENIFKEWMRGEMKQRMMETLDDLPEHYNVEDAKSDPLNLIVQNEEAETILQSIETLPEAERHVLFLRNINNLSYSEIAVRLNRSENACKQLHYRALMKLKRALSNLV